MEQRSAALERATRIRVKNAEIKRTISGMPASEAVPLVMMILRDPQDTEGSLRVGQLLRWSGRLVRAG